MNRRELAKNGFLGLCGMLAMPKSSGEAHISEPEHELGTLKHEEDGSVYKYGKVDFGSIWTDAITGETYHSDQYTWFPWNGIARRKIFMEIGNG